ncbi:MAG: hypothetical protein LBQ55_05475 [Treponema sp.]|jgi:predicted HTH transcriptional regulator|nr:hypothetical protein [Treponema sp.]
MKRKTRTGAAEKKPPQSVRITTGRESGLHRALKYRCTGAGGETEISRGKYICDGINKKGEIIEVQTGSFRPLKQKIKDLAVQGKVRIIHPIVLRKDIEVYDSEGNWLYRRRSPRRGSEWDLFRVLIHAPEFPETAGLTIELALVEVREKRVKDGKGSWRRNGASIADRELSAWQGSVSLAKKRDYRRFVPFGAKERFTARDLAEKAEINRVLATKTLYVLQKINLVKRIEKKGRAWIYTTTLNRDKKGGKGPSAPPPPLHRR